MDREPFSNAPDPDFYFNSRAHTLCFQKLEIALRLKRGLNVVIGDIGTGKTTLCRKLIRTFSKDQEFECHLLLDPSFDTADDFLSEITAAFDSTHHVWGTRKIKEHIKQVIFTKAKEQDKNLVLIIDEGQKLPLFCLEILRELLNFETNTHKLLQIVIFAQKEFNHSLDKMPNFADRINLLHVLEPMNFRDTRSMIRFRIQQACSNRIPPRLFSFPALFAIHLSTKGHPRKVINICHQCVLSMIIQNRSRIGWRQSRSCIRRASLPGIKNQNPVFKTAGIALASLMIVLIAGGIEINRHFNFQNTPVTKFYPVRNTIQDGHKAAVNQLNIGTVPSLEKPEITAHKPDKTGKPEDLKSSIDKDEPEIFSQEALASSSGHDSFFSSGEVQNTPMMDAPKVSLEPTVAIHPPPEDIGTVVIKKNDTLGKMITLIYGVYKTATVKVILKINPHIRNPNTIKEGDIIRFPVIPRDQASKENRFAWIKLYTTKRLSDAIDKTNTISGYGYPLRIATILSGDGTLLFDILLKEAFLDHRSAKDRLHSLPTDLTHKAAVISTWPDGALVLFDLLTGIDNKQTG